MKWIVAAGLAGSLCLAAAPPRAQEQASAAAQKAAAVCRNCHGPRGDSISRTFPRLNGQQRDYISAQLREFREHKRSDPHAVAYMWGMASHLDNELIAGLAKYYSEQSPTLPQTGGSLAAEGKGIYEGGAPADGVPPCQACHGAHGEGNGIVPRLAGQHADYLKKQLEAFRSTLRESDIMHANTANMTDSEIEAVVSYLGND